MIIINTEPYLPLLVSTSASSVMLGCSVVSSEMSKIIKSQEHTHNH